MKTRLLFVCTANVDRSPTAEGLYSFSDKFEAQSCGTTPWARRPVTRDLLDWADVVVCMEETHRDAILAGFGPLPGKRVVVLGIPDEYLCNDPHLVMQIRTAMEREGLA
ncbi:MAG: phosphotyrosine protein phosphatase [Kiritimatiellae bacterium]|nr:phosphotyrosine protein phosphatase [Kiritimatiellia bacterium]